MKCKVKSGFPVVMEGLEDWTTAYCGEDGAEEFMFPMLDTQVIQYCPRLSLQMGRSGALRLLNLRSIVIK
jgi:hypothetical protein